ncbi:MAG: PilZ domain-containing protein [Bdellovibrio sp.]|nr:PilZ domain-containing protein [Bdellovibrio sp.]
MIKKLGIKLFQILPESVRHKIYRNRAAVPAFALDENFSIEVARTEADLENSYRLLHDSYVTAKLMRPDASGLRCNLYTFLPHSTVIVAKYKGEVVGTVSLIRDSIWGLPSDKDYKNENDQLRFAGHRLIEVSALAVSKSFRQSGNSVSLLLMKYLFNYTYTYSNSDRLVCTVHPRAEDFYKALWQFDRNGKVVSYQFVQGALAIHLSMEVSAAKLKVITAAYPTQTVDRNLVLFVMQKDDRFKYPTRKLGAHIDPVLTPELFEHFCVNKTKAWQSFSDNEKKSLYNIYLELFGYCNPDLNITLDDHSILTRAYRAPIELSAFVKDDKAHFFTHITDLSSGGAFISWPTDQADPGTEVTLSFKLGGQTIRTKAAITWKNRGQSHLQPYGFGIKFLKSETLSATTIKAWLYDQAG